MSKKQAAVSEQVQAKFDSKHLSTLTVKSHAIRYLASCGLRRGEIAKTLGIRYQWVRNVLITPVKGS